MNDTTRTSLWNKTEGLLESWRGAPPAQKELCNAVDPEHRGDYYTMLEEWEEEGKLVLTHKGGIGLPHKLGFAAGRLQHNAKNAFGFVIPAEGEGDIYVPQDKMSGALNGDQVLVRLANKRARPNQRVEGSIAKILRRKITHVVGAFEREENGGYVTPDDTRVGIRVWVNENDAMGATSGNKVVCQIIRYPEANRGAAGCITQVLGMVGDIGIDILSVIHALSLPQDFPPRVEKEAANQPEVVSAADIKNRLDLRKKHVFTIDGADAKDLDDAVSVEKLPKGGWLLGVHIADVSHYITQHSALDKEAYDRGTSVYLIDRVIPMLPTSLSNGICSLHGGVERLTLSCQMELDTDGNVLSSEIQESVICSAARLTYDEVNAWLTERNADVAARYPTLTEDFDEMERLAAALRKKRTSRGAIDLDIAEPYIELDSQGTPVNVSPRERGPAHKLIEELMLCANEAVAEWAGNLHLPILYRVHENPDFEKIQNLNRFVQKFNYTIPGLHGTIKPKALQSLLHDVSGQPEEGIISRILLRSMQKARYAPQDSGHFGLAAQHYCHFTSPIRRYPDLWVHRAIKAVLRGNADPEWYANLEETAGEASRQCSEREVVAMEAERMVDSMKMAEYMSHHIGETFDGMIAGVTDFGVFVELPSTIEGLVRMAALDDDFYVFDEKQYCLVGKRTRRTYRLGDPMRVKVIKADPTSRQIDFEPAPME